MPDPSPTPTFRRTLAGRLGLASLFGLGAWAAYRHGLHAPFLFDDLGAVRDNVSIRHLWPLPGPLSPHTGGSGVDGRPLVNLSLALNYAWGGLVVDSYRWFNLIAHTLTALLLLALIRRTIECAGPTTRLAADAGPLALVVSLLWLLHPLQTESVLSAQNRSEILASFFYLLTLYALARSAGSGHPRRWHALTFLACLAGMAAKEIMVSAPLAALLYDRTYLAGTFAAAWRTRGRLYLALAAAWILLALLVLADSSRSGTAGFGHGVTSWHYLLTQCRGIVIYLKLSLWPAPLVFHYGTATVDRLAVVWPQALLLTGLAGATAWALWHHPRLGFPAFIFFAVLAPSSSVVPIITQTLAEHRMYLPLAAVLVFVTLAIHAVSGRKGLVLLAAAVPVLGAVTFRRTADYRSELTLWTDTVAKAPDNPVARNNLGSVFLEQPGHLAEATICFETALQLDPTFTQARYNFGCALLRTPGRLPEAIAAFEAVLRAEPDSSLALNNLGNAYSFTPGALDRAIACFKAALRLKPDFADAHYNLGLAYARQPDGLRQAIGCYEAALRADPDYTMARNNLGNVYLRLNRRPEAIACYRETLRRAPDYPEAHNNLGLALAAEPGRLDEAVAQFREAVRLNPRYSAAYCNLGLALLQTPGHRSAARQALATALQLDPGLDLARENLATLDAAGD